MRPERIVSALGERGVEAISLPGVDEIIEHLVRRRSGRDGRLAWCHAATQARIVRLLLAWIDEAATRRLDFV